MRTRPGGLVISAMLCAACGGEGMDNNTRCQYEDPDLMWQNVGLRIIIQQPSPTNCPVTLLGWGQLINLSADIYAPPNKVVGYVAWKVYPPNGSTSVGDGVATFLPQPDMTDKADADGQYQAGTERLQGARFQQDRMFSNVPILFSQLDANNRVYLPYQAPGISASTVALTGLPRAKKGRATIVRAMPTNIPSSPAPIIQWFRNGVQYTPPSNPWGVGGLNGTAFPYTPTTMASIDWTFKIGYSFPTQWKTITVRQYVDP